MFKWLMDRKMVELASEVEILKAKVDMMDVKIMSLRNTLNRHSAYGKQEREGNSDMIGRSEAERIFMEMYGNPMQTEKNNNDTSLQ